MEILKETSYGKALEVYHWKRQKQRPYYSKSGEEREEEDRRRVGDSEGYRSQESFGGGGG